MIAPPQKNRARDFELGHYRFLGEENPRNNATARAMNAVFRNPTNGRSALLLESDGLLDELRSLADVLNGSLACAGLVVFPLDVVVRFVE